MVQAGVGETSTTLGISSIRRILEDTHISEDLPYKEKTCNASQGNSVLRHYKNPKTLRKQVHIIHPSSSTLTKAEERDNGYPRGRPRRYQY